MTLWCALASVMLGCATSRGPRLEELRRSRPLLGTFVVISVYGEDKRLANEAISAAFDEIQRVDAIMSLHRTDSELARVNAAAAAKPHPVSRELFNVVAAALEIAGATEGSFDPTVGALIQQWGFLWKEHRLPAEAEIRDALKRVGHRFVTLNTNAQTISFSADGLVLDLNGIAKGYAVDCAVAKLREYGVTNAMVRAGGDLRAIGAPPGQTAWNVRIEDPNKRGARKSIELHDAAISTSGSYENYFEVAGRRYSHILDPRTGLPVEGAASCTVIAPTCMESDAWATALFVFGPEKSARHFAEQLPFRFVLESGRVTASPAFPAEH